MFPEGAEIKVVGAPARTEEFACYTETIAFANGQTFERNSTIDDDGAIVQPARELTIGEGIPNIAGNWVASRPERGERPIPPQPKNGENVADDAPVEGERPTGPPPGAEDRINYQLTEAGKAAVEGYARDDMPRLHCTATNIFEDWTFDQIVNKIVQTEEDIILSYGFMDIERTIHLDLDEHPSDITPSKAGYSIGKWDDGVLIVDTIGFQPGYISAPPMPDGAVKNSEQFHVVERYAMSEDGKTLSREYEGEDPLYLAEKFSGSDTVNYSDAVFEPYDCEDLTEEVR